MIVEQPKFTCELCGGVHPTSEHKKPKEGESQQELPESDYVEDNPEAVAKDRPIHPGKEMASFTGTERLHEYLDDLKAKLRQLKEDQRLR